MADALTVVSNFSFFAPFVEAYERGYIDMAASYLLIMICSSLYHTCNSFSGSCAGLPPHVLHHMDFFFAQFIIPQTALFIVHFPEAWMRFKRMVALLILFAIFLTLQFFEATLSVQIVIGGISFLFIVLYWLVYAMLHNGALPPYNWSYFSLAIGLTSVSVSLFAVQMSMPSMYWANHSAWHVLAALSQYWLLQIWGPKPSKPEKEERCIPERYVPLNRPAAPEVTWRPHTTLRRFESK